ncbi:MAG: substrate-binding domain-containing protein [Lyngbya sp.]|nr:substrate-binding domain-containing protein [Lyngbya sp.]
MNTPMIVIKLQLLESSEPGFHVNLTMLKSQEDFDSINGFLAAPPSELETSFKNWQESYFQLDGVRKVYTRINPKSAICYSSLEQRNAVKHYLNQWLNNNDRRWQLFREELIYILSKLKNSGEETGILLDVSNTQLSHFPWQEWQLLESRFPDTEIAIRVRGSDKIKSPLKSDKIKILMVIGTHEGLDTNQDLQVIQSLEQKGAEVKILIQPSKQELSDVFLKEDSYHIFVFSGHSESDEEDQIGWIYINDSPKGRISIDEFKNNFRFLIEKGLQLAIFNSCDGLGLAHQLAKLNLPRCIVMREPVPDQVAIRFLEYFFAEFTQNKSLFSCVNRAKKALELFDFDDENCPGAMWLPTLCVRESALSKPLTWEGLKQSETFGHKLNFKFITKTLLIGILGVSLSVIAWNIFSGARRQEPEVCPQTIISRRQSNRCFAYVSNVPEGTIWHGGSTTWAPIHSIINPQIKKIFPEFNLTYKQHPTLPPGSRTGIDMLLKGQLVFAESSRPLKNEELQEARNRGFQLKQVPVAIDAIAVIVHPDIEIPGLSIEQLRDIYLGKINNWKEVGGPDLKITPYSRPTSGGTTQFFQENILGDENFSNNVVEISTTTEATRQVAQNPGGIYYASAPEIVPQCSVKPLPIRQFTGEFIAPYKGSLVSPENCPNERNQLNIEAFQTNEYPLTRKIFVIVRLDGSIDEQAGEAYAKLLLTNQGQELIESAGFIPLSSF